MYKKFLELFGKENLLNEAIEMTINMLRIDREMYLASTESLRKTDDAVLPFNIYEKDKEINRFERRVRRNVLTHLTVSGVHNIVPGLVLVSIVIDVERIGDYTKNITELAIAHPKKLTGGKYEKSLIDIEEIVTARFDRVIDIISEMDMELAKKVMSEHYNISARVDKIIVEMIGAKETDLPRGSLVTCALYFRYLKRIASHLTNITSSIVNPFPRIGFRSKDYNE